MVLEDYATRPSAPSERTVPINKYGQGDIFARFIPPCRGRGRGTTSLRTSLSGLTAGRRDVSRTAPRLSSTRRVLITSYPSRRGSLGVIGGAHRFQERRTVDNPDEKNAAAISRRNEPRLRTWTNEYILSSRTASFSSRCR